MKNLASQFMKSVLMILIITLISCTETSKAQGSGSIDGIELGINLQLNLNNLVRQDFQKEQLIEKVLPYFESLTNDFNSIKVYNANTTIDTSVKHLKILVFNLQEGKFKDALLSIVFESDGTINKVRIWGNDFVDNDLEASVENFYRQFDKKRKALPLSNILSEVNAKSYIDSLTELERYPYTHAKTMLNNNHLIRKTWGYTSKGEIPDVSFFENKRDGFLYLLRNADKLDSWSSKEYIQDYKKAASSTIEILNNVIDYMKSDKKTSSSKIKSMVVSSKGRENLCNRCHATPSVSNNQVDIYKQIRKDFIYNGMRQDLYQLDFDIWGIPKIPNESQNLAHLVKAGTIAFQVLNKQ